MSRLRCMLGGIMVWLGAGPGGAGAEPTLDFAAVRARAREVAAQAYRPAQGSVPEWLRQLTYDQLRRIEFDGRRSLWHREQLPFEVQFLHPGFLFDRSVRLFELRGSRPESVRFRREDFNYHGVAAGEFPADLGFAGFRLMHPFAGPGTSFNEIGSFAGASYFRFLCARAAYGLSARGLALNTGEPMPEEFPRFSEFWLERPSTDAKHLIVFALLESESAAGAYRFVVKPGATTTVEVQAAVYFRRDPGVVGIAPLTSMFWRGENSNVAAEDFRPEVHDSDGLLLCTGAGEWIWRPLVNPTGLRVATFTDDGLRGFGLLQRDRDFESYQDLEAHYHERPGAWVETMGHWGRGGVRLVEIPTNREIDDNIVALWVPEKKPVPGEALEIEYRIHWHLEPPGPSGGYVRATRRGRSAVYEPGFERFVVDFAGTKLAELPASAALEPVVSVGSGARLNHATLQKNPINGTWRAAFTLKPDGSGRPVELRCYVRSAGEALSETWSYLWQP